MIPITIIVMMVIIIRGPYIKKAATKTHLTQNYTANKGLR